MDEITKKNLFERNNRIIQTVIKKAKSVCPNSIALIGICGSFYTGDYYEKSDLDLLIVTNDNEGHKIGDAFILQDVAHDIYCISWSKLERMASYDDPFVSHVIDVEIVYCTEDKYQKRFDELKNKALAILNSPLSKDIYEKAVSNLKEALFCYSNVMLEEDQGNCKFVSSGMLYHIKNALCLLNHNYFKFGVKRHLKELLEMEIVPKNFSFEFMNVVNSISIDDIKTTSTILLKSINKLFHEVGINLEENKPIPTVGALRGTYEEMFSNWKNKMHQAAKEHDVHLSLMTVMSCQNFYDEMHRDNGTQKIELMKHFNPNNLIETALNFDIEMENYLQEYKKLEISIKKYSTIDEFENDYLMTL